ncbi:MAG: CoA pyrophosphatase [Burkholderiaceae bacterium]
MVNEVRGNGWNGAGDPRQLPAKPARDNLEPLTVDRLSVDALRSRFADANRPWPVEKIPDRRGLAGKSESRPAAVLVPLMVTDADSLPSVLLTTRPSHLRTHSGQIAFPGGRVDAVDENRIATALREANEEVGLEAGDIEILGEMPVYFTGSGFHITPVIGVIRSQPRLRLDPREVDEVFQVPLQWLMDPANHERRYVNTPGEERSFYSMPWVAEESRVEYFIWGVTAAILRNLYHYIRA